MSHRHNWQCMDKEVPMDVIQALTERRSVNYFDPDRKIPKETLIKLLETANHSPSSFNLQPWRLIVVEDPERKRVLRRCAFDQPKAEEASAMLIIIADPKGVEANLDRVLESWQILGYIQESSREMLSGMAKNLYGTEESVQRKLFAVKNASLFAMNIMFAAKGLGLETHPLDGFDEGCIKSEFGISEDKIVPMLIAVGYLKPGVTLLPRAFRRDIQEFVKQE